MCVSRLLSAFYSVDSADRGTLGSSGRLQSSCFTATAPAFLLFATLTAPFVCTQTGRAAWCKLTLIGTAVSWAWVLVRS